ncbi:MAG: MFS transporter [Saprospiraceae bacterium]|nr:MFS transporter [Saprospiraceae bacterium]
MPAAFKINSPKIIKAWSFFDWANSAFALVITTAIFPAYYIEVTSDEIAIGSIVTSNSALYAYAISAAYLIIAALSPLLSGIADAGGRRMFFMRFFTILGSISCLFLFFFIGMEQLWLGTAAFVLGLIGYAGGLVFNNAYLPLIVTADRFDQVSAKGYSFGYIGSLLLLIICLVVIQLGESLGLPGGTFPVRLSFLLVGIWWIGFSIIPFKKLPADQRVPTQGIIQKGFDELKWVWSQVKSQDSIRQFLWSFFCYSAGVQTVLFLAATFAEKELNFATFELILLILLLQVLAIFGAYIFARLSRKRGNKFSLNTMLLLWTAICGVAFFVDGKIPFYILASTVGLVMGGIQALSRATYSKLIPEGTKDTTSYFSFYDVLEKVAIVLGTLTFGLLDQLTGSMRISILMLTLFFIGGILLLRPVKFK